MAVSDYSGLTITNPQVGVQITKVTDSSADWPSVANSTYFYDKADKLVHYKNSSGVVLELFSAPGIGDALTTNPLSQFASTTSLQLAGVISDETGSGSLVFANSPTLVNPVVGTQTANDNSTKAASTAYVDSAIATVTAGATNYGIVHAIASGNYLT